MNITPKLNSHDPLKGVGGIKYLELNHVDRAAKARTYFIRKMKLGNL